MKYNIKVHNDGKTNEYSAADGENLLKLLHRNGYEISSPCGGSGTCGKCKIRISGSSDNSTKKEKKLLGDDPLSKGYRLACYVSVEEDMDIFLDEGINNAKIITDGKKSNIKLSPLISKKYFSLTKPDLTDQRSDLERLCNYVGIISAKLDMELMRKLPAVLREQSFNVTTVYFGNKLIDIEAGNTTGKMYGLAVDVGTTTIAAYLIDLVSGKELGVSSCLNPQRKFGSDVISRISYTNDSTERLQEMNSSVIDCINSLISDMSKSAGIEPCSIYSVVLVGNTTMMHFLMNINAKYIAVAPFIPATTDLHIMKASNAGIDINCSGSIVMVPSVSAYIGADTLAAILSCGMYEDEEISLLIDIGTNGEIVLGSKKWLYSCSVAAGPAFEGAHIRNGIGGIEGAIDSINLMNGLEYTTIGGGRAIGICGSGIVDAAAQMLQKGIIDETGRIVDPDELDLGAQEFKKRIIELEGITSFLICESHNNAAATDIAITQKDIRELQNAKAAVAAGVNILIKEAGIKINDIKHVYLAGGFGSYLNIDSAQKIGLLPKLPDGRIESIGNAAGSGAVDILKSAKMVKKADKIKKMIKYIELSSNKDFTNQYIELMGFDY